MLSGGAHFTAAVTQASRERRPSSADTDVGWLARPARCIARNSQSPDRSPVNTRPVRFAPCAAGARPSTRIARPRVAEARARRGPSTPRRGTTARFVDGHLLAPGDQARAAPAVTTRRRAGERGESTGCTVGFAGRDGAHENSTANPAHSTLVLLVRHGQTPTTGKVLPGRAPGLHLADAGTQQAQRAAERIAELKTVDAIYASPLERARETAAPIAAARGLKVQIDKGLLECDFGDWTGAELKKLMKLPEWGTVQRAPSTFRFPGGESFTEMQTRIVGAIDRLRAQHPGGVDRVRVARRPDQGRRRPRDGHAPRPVPAHRHQHLLDQRHRLRHRRARSCSPSTPPAARSPSCARREPIA